MFQCNDLLLSLFLPPFYASLFFGSNVSIHLPSSQQQMALAANLGFPQVKLLSLGQFAANLGFPQGKLLSLGQFAACRPARPGPAEACVATAEWGRVRAGQRWRWAGWAWTEMLALGHRQRSDLPAASSVPRNVGVDCCLLGLALI